MVADRARAAIAGAALMLAPAASLLCIELLGWSRGLQGAYPVLLPTYLLLAVLMVGVGGALVRQRVR
ncbi:hypothetical protein [Rugosimonospora acidiphila]|uniref:hypothetical protein n=1 Tax=Rugosimonospora acidiphila TaxID=556531 RepID=UPI0031E52780